MIRITNFASEHKLLPDQYVDKSEMRKSNALPDYLKVGKDQNERYKIYCTYAWIETDEIDSENFPVTVITYRPKYSKRTQYVLADPIWDFMKDERTPEQQKFIDKNLDKLNTLFIECAQSQGYLTDLN